MEFLIKKEEITLLQKMAMLVLVVGVYLICTQGFSYLEAYIYFGLSLGLQIANKVISQRFEEPLFCMEFSKDEIIIRITRYEGEPFKLTFNEIQVAESESLDELTELIEKISKDY